MMKCKINSISIIILMFLVGFLLLGNYSCKKIVAPNSGDGIKDTIRYDFLKSRIFVQFVDAATNENIISYNGEILSVEVVGKSNMAVADIIGIQKDRYYPKNGFLTFGIFPEFVPSTVNPIRFTIKTSLSNHYPASKEIIITNDGDYYIKIPIINIEFPPDGVIVSQLSNVGNLYNGIVHSDVSISTTNSEAQVIIPAGTELISADSTELSGNLNLTLIYHSNDNDVSMATIQGGISSSILKNNYSPNVLFYPAGVVDLTISDSDGREAYYINKKMLEITIKIPDNVYNPTTYSHYKLGDEVEVFSYLLDTGLWNYENTSTIISEGNGLATTVLTYGLHSYNIGNYKSVSCNEGLSFKLSGDYQEYGSLTINGVMRKKNDDSFITNVTLAAKLNTEINVPYRTGNNAVYIEWSESGDCNNCVVNPANSPLEISDMCTHPEVNLPLIDNGSSPTSIMANFSGQCSSDTNFLILPSFGVWYKKVDSPCWQWTSMNNGQAKISNLMHGETYVIGTYFNDRWKEWNITIEDLIEYNFKIDFSSAACNNVFGII